MKNIHFISVLACLLLLGSCKSIMFDDNVMKVVEGMQQKEVKDLLGTPTHRRFDQGIEEWEYIQQYTTGMQRVVIIGFSDQRVTSMDSFETPIPKTPQGPGPGKPHDRGKNPRH